VLASAIALAAITGCRRGELCGLRWSDLDVDHGVLRVQRAAKHGLDYGQIVMRDPKSHQARSVILDELGLAVLANHRARVLERADAAEVAVDAEGYILSMDLTGRTPVKPSSMSQPFRRVAQKAGVTLRFHDLRHFTATQLIGAGVDVRTVAERLGHADPSMTLRVYAAAIEQRHREAAAVLGALVAPPPLNG
jgi:integrase